MSFTLIIRDEDEMFEGLSQEPAMGYIRGRPPSSIDISCYSELIANQDSSAS